MSSLLSTSNDVLRCIFVQNSSEDLLALRQVNKELHIFATQVIFSLNATIHYQKRLLQYWSFKPSFMKDNVDTKLIFNALGNPNFSPLERIPGLLVIASHNNIHLPIEKMVASLGPNADLTYTITHSSMCILMKLIPRLPEHQLESFLKSVIMITMGSPHKESNFQLMEMLVDSLSLHQKTFKLKTIIDECYNQQKDEPIRNIRRIGLYSFTDHVLTKDELNVLINKIVENKADLCFDAHFCLKLIAPKLTKEQISSILDPIVIELASSWGRVALSKFNVLSALADSMTPEQFSKTYDLIIFLLNLANQISVDFTLHAINILIVLMPRLTPKQCMELIESITKTSVCLYQDRQIKILGELASKITKDEMPRLMKGIMSRIINGNWLMVLDFDFLISTNHLLTAAHINAILYPIVKSLESANPFAAEPALKVLKIIASKLNTEQIESLITHINENLTHEDVVVTQKAFYLISGLATRLNAEQISVYLRLIVARIQDDKTNDIWVANALMAIISLEPELNKKHINFIFEPLFAYLSKVVRKSQILANFNLDILIKLALKITEEQYGRFLEWLLTNIENKDPASRPLKIARGLTPLIPKLSNEHINYLLPRIINRNSVDLLKGIAPRLTSEQIEIILKPLLELTSEIASVTYVQLGVLSILVPQFSEKQCSTVLNCLLIPVSNHEYTDVREEAIQIISDMMFQKKFGYDAIIEAEIQKDPEAILLYNMAIWLKQMKNI